MRRDGLFSRRAMLAGTAAAGLAGAQATAEEPALNHVVLLGDSMS
jgi:hypothetical protein